MAKRVKRASQIAALFIDFDHFKHINDHLGHAAGDSVLIEFAKRLTSISNSNVQAFRHGGDEFVIIIDRAEPKNINEVVARIQDILRQDFVIGDIRHEISCSIGSALYPNDALEANDLLRKADIALYHAKSQGRRIHIAFETSQLSENAAWISIANRLRNAQTEPSIYHAFQSIYATGTQERWGAEALLRVARGKKPDDYYRPDMVMVVAHELGLHDIVANHSISNALSWLQTQPKATQVTVNLSWAQLGEEHIFDFFGSECERLDIDPARIVVELTEDQILHDQKLRNMLQRYSNHGFGIALDDFGSGFSALSCLTELPLNIVKIDKSLISSFEQKSNVRALFLGIVDIAHNLNLRVVAEGIETAEHLDEANLAGCEMVQGFLLGRPELCDISNTSRK